MNAELVFINLKIEKNKEEGLQRISLEINLKEILKGFLHAVFVGPRLRRQSAPGQYQHLNINRAPSLY